MVTAAIWLAILLCTISSILGQPFSRRQRVFWILMVTLVPVLGMLAYLPFSIRRDELPTAFLIRGSSKDKKKGSPRLIASRSR
jgi:hypothetical protein